MSNDTNDTTSSDVEQVLDLLQEAKDHILREIGELVSLMDEAKECLCAPCCVKITNKYSEYIEPLMEKYEELENGDRAQPASDESDRRTP